MLDRAEIKAVLTRILTETQEGKSVVESLMPTQDLRDLGLSSLGLAHFMIRVERALGVLFAVDDLTAEDRFTLDSIAKMVCDAQQSP